MREENKTKIRKIIKNIEFNLTGREMGNIGVTEAKRKFQYFYERGMQNLPNESQDTKVNFAKSLFQGWLYFEKKMPKEQILYLSDQIFKSGSNSV